jgi:hypothetical protein
MKQSKMMTAIGRAEDRGDVRLTQAMMQFLPAFADGSVADSALA